MYEIFPGYVKDLQLQEGVYQSFILENSVGGSTAIPVVLDAKTLSKEEFFARYESQNVPCVIRNIPAGYDDGKYVGEWPALRKWDLESLERDEELLERRFKCGEDDDECSIKIKLEYFMKYLRENNDDSPLYIFDTAFDEDDVAKRILSEYKVPSYFREDLFNFVSEKRRPPYRWWLVGPERSGTCVHIDPLATSAWNTLLYGKKRWVLFPPHVPKRIVKGSGLIRDHEDDEAVHYFTVILPRIKRKATQNKGHPDYKGFACYEFTQEAGETCFIPRGWWHAVLNVTHTVGVTQNFCSPRNFDHVWRKTRSGRKKMASKWLSRLEKHYPHLAERARELNREDNFNMKYDPRSEQAEKPGDDQTRKTYRL